MKFTGNITPTKIASVLILSGGILAGLLLEDSSIVILALSISGGLLGYRKHEERKIIESNKK